ncbi:MAG: hypothetical protein ROO70_08415 [Labrenzia sp.]
MRGWAVAAVPALSRDRVTSPPTMSGAALLRWLCFEPFAALLAGEAGRRPRWLGADLVNLVILR